MPVAYYWNVLEMADDEVAEVHGQTTLRQALAIHKLYSGSQIELVREVVSSDGRTIDRSWAAYKNGTLPAAFSYGNGEEAHKMPRRFLKECERARQAN